MPGSRLSGETFSVIVRRVCAPEASLKIRSNVCRPAVVGKPAMNQDDDSASAGENSRKPAGNSEPGATVTVYGGTPALAVRPSDMNWPTLTSASVVVPV